MRPINFLPPISDAEALGKSNFFNELHPSKAFSPIFCTQFGIVRLTMLVQSLKAFSAIYVTPSGTTMSPQASFEHSTRMLSPSLFSILNKEEAWLPQYHGANWDSKPACYNTEPSSAEQVPRCETAWSNPGLLHSRRILYRWATKEVH